MTVDLCLPGLDLVFSPYPPKRVKSVESGTCTMVRRSVETGYGSCSNVAIWIVHSKGVPSDYLVATETRRIRDYKEDPMGKKEGSKHHNSPVIHPTGL